MEEAVLRKGSKKLGFIQAAADRRKVSPLEKTL